MSASLDHDPRNLYRRISCAAAELRAHGDVVTAFARVVDDLCLAGFERMAEALGEVVSAAKGHYTANAELEEDRIEALNDLDKANAKVEALEERIAELHEASRDAAYERDRRS